MHKLIKKYQQPWEPFSKSLADYTIKNSVDFLNWGFPKIKNTALTPKLNWTLQGTKSAFSTGQLPTEGAGAAAGLGKIGWDLASKAPELIDSGLQMAGVKKAETVGGWDQGLDAIGKIGMDPGLLAATGGLSAIPAAFSLANNYFGKTAKEQGTKGLDTGSYAFQTSAQAGKKQTLLGTWGKKDKQANNLTALTDRSNLLAGNATYQNKQNVLSAQSTFGDILTKNKQKLFGGVQTNILAAKKGTKINPIELRNIISQVIKTEPEVELEIPKFEEGGKLNVIPEGALHARKHDLPEEIAEQVTNKGIPVVTYDEGGEITQHAEIEKNEIIFNKETTDTLEDLFKQYNESKSEEKKAQLAIKAGKFLTSEILENTDDRTGLLNEVE